MGASNSTPEKPPQATPSRGECPVDHKQTQEKKEVTYNVYSQPIDPTNQMPLNPNQTPAVGQTKPLETKRVSSSIPKGGANGETWQYPSPQMFFNALRRKGKGEDVSEDDVETIVAVHNNMNERSWADLLQWEALHQDTCCAPRLSRFKGRPDDLSPKAWFKSTFLGYPKPFDRHDWTIDRCGKEVRYVIDYYYDEDKSTQDEKPELKDVTSIKSISFEVRPAIDSVESLFDRIRLPVLQAIGMEPSVDDMMEKQEQLRTVQPAQASVVSQSGCPVDHSKAQSGCPVDHKKTQGECPVDHKKTLGECPVDHKKTQGECPVDHKHGKVNNKSGTSVSEELATEVAALPSQPTDMSKLTEKEVREAALLFGTHCKSSFVKLQNCDSEDSCNKASIAMNYCMADLVCSFEATKYLKDPQSGDAYSGMVDCLNKFENRAREVLGKRPEE